MVCGWGWGGSWRVWEGLLSQPPCIQLDMNLAADWLSVGLRIGPAGIRGMRERKVQRLDRREGEGWRVVPFLKGEE